MIYKKAKLIIAVALPLYIQAGSDDFNHQETHRGKSNLRPNLDSKMATLNEFTKDVDLEDEDFWTRFLEDGFSFVPTPPAPAPAPTIPFVARPPTKMPTMDGGKCDLMMNVLCEVPIGSARVPCGEFPRPLDESECEKRAEFVYKVTNTCDDQVDPNCDTAVIDMFDIVRNGRLINLMRIVENDPFIPPSETVFYLEDEFPEFDFCDNKTVDTSALIIGDTTDGLGMCIAEGSNLFDIGFPPDRKCDVAVDLLCYVEIDGERINCQDIPMPEDEEDCDKEVIYSYIVTNVGTTGKTIELIERDRDGEVVDITMLADRLQLAPGEFAIARELRQMIDFCIARIITTVVTTESIGDGVGETSCTDMDTHLLPIDIICDVEVQVECFASTATGFDVPCDQFNPYASRGTAGAGCEQVLKYVYTITNTGPGDERVRSIRVERFGEAQNILDGRFILEPDETREVDDYTLLNFCEEYPSGVTTSVQVIAEMFPIGGACESTDELTFFPDKDECFVILNPSVECTTENSRGNELSCIEYIYQLTDEDDPEVECEKEVLLEYELFNEGNECVPISKVISTIDGGNSVDITPTLGTVLCPGDKLTLSEMKVVDFCTGKDFDIPVEVVVNDGPIESCGGFGQINFVYPEDETCVLLLDLTCESSSGDECLLTFEKAQCDFRPCYIDFEFTSGTCETSSNSQGQHFSCVDDYEDAKNIPFSQNYILVQSLHRDRYITYFSGMVDSGSTFRVGKDWDYLEQNLTFMVYEEKGGALLQKFDFDSSCSKPLFTGDVFGSVTAIAFGSKTHHIPKEGSASNDFNFKYEISNVGLIDADLMDITFTFNGQAESPIDLTQVRIDSGSTYSNIQTFLNKTPLKMLEVSAKANGEDQCSANGSLILDSDCMLAPTKCTGCPSRLSLRFTGGSCNESNNHQTIQCSDFNAITDNVYIIISDDTFQTTYFKGEVSLGDEFESVMNNNQITKYEKTVVKVMVPDPMSPYSEMKVAQIIKFGSNCVEPLFVDDVYGALEITGWTNKEQGDVRTGDTEC